MDGRRGGEEKSDGKGERFEGDNARKTNGQDSGGEYEIRSGGVKEKKERRAGEKTRNQRKRRKGKHQEKKQRKSSKGRKK